MCLVCRNGVNFKTTVQDIVCFKVVKTTLHDIGFVTPYYHTTVVLNEEYSLPYSTRADGNPAEIHHYDVGTVCIEGGMFHMVTEYEDAKRLKDILQSRAYMYGSQDKFYILKAIIPAGALTISGICYINLGCSVESICSKKVKYTEIME